MSAGRRTASVLVGLLLLVGGFAGLALAAPVGPAAVLAAASGTVEFVNVTATSTYTFSPDQFTVPPGSSVHLMVTQQASTLHTFVLSSVANFTIPTTYSSAQLYAWVALHPPMVNISLGSTPGAVTYANFTAPAAGTYEFFCIVAGHFQAGMHGTMNAGSTSSSNSGPSTLEIAVIAIVVIVVIAVVALLVLRGRRGSPPTTAPPATAPPPTTTPPPTTPSPPSPPTPPSP